MKILAFIIANADSILIVLAFFAGIIALIAKKQYNILDQITLVLVTEAEKKYGNGTGTVKLAAVVDWLYPKIPAVIRLFITEKQVIKIIERVLSDAQDKWNSNPQLLSYIRALEANHDKVD